MESGFFKIGRFGGAPIRIHWTTPIGAFLFCGFAFVPAAWAAFVVLILVHELGHAAFVRAFGLQLQSVDVLGIGGVCKYFGVTTPIRSALIAWGGVLGQSVLLAIALVVRLFLPPVVSPWMGQILSTLIMTNLYIMAINLIPVGGFDGVEAWKLFGRNGLPAWWRRRKLLKSQPKGVVRAMPRAKFRTVADVDDILENTPTGNKRPPPSMLN